jgi:hypothetical protein
MTSHYLASGKKIRVYGHKEVVLSFTHYLRNNRTCLRLMTVENGQEVEPVAVCTVNLPNVPMKSNEVAVKTWYENVGMLGWLMEHKIVSEPQRYAYYAGVFIPICTLLVRHA